MHHHSKNEFSLFSCLVLSSFCVLFSCLFSPFPSSLLSRSLSSFSVSVSVSVSFSVWCCVCDVLCFVVLCVLCVLMCVLVCDTLRNSVCPLNTSPCVRSKRPGVYRHHAHMFQHMCAWCRYKRGGFERTHGDVFSSVKQVIF